MKYKQSIQKLISKAKSQKEIDLLLSITEDVVNSENPDETFLSNMRMYYLYFINFKALHSRKWTGKPKTWVLDEIRNYLETGERYSQEDWLGEQQ